MVKVHALNSGAAESRMAKEPRQCPYCGGAFDRQDLRPIQDDARLVQQRITCQACSAVFQLTFRVHEADLIKGPYPVGPEELIS